MICSSSFLFIKWEDSSNYDSNYEDAEDSSGPFHESEDRDFDHDFAVEDPDSKVEEKKERNTFYEQDQSKYKYKRNYVTYTSVNRFEVLVAAIFCVRATEIFFSVVIWLKKKQFSM